ncbi:hypothetical protein J1N35_025989 [Gossypium stocksii]|uniref:Uncharacterized protein n=1 Tax=Gossypium stocksii TaxID=47602 RepID=A0A9D3V7C4_9ROSI|nr:hypothetical protein J1N35_025989 [Gossypium stocksii]
MQNSCPSSGPVNDVAIVESPLGFETPIQAKKNDRIIAHINLTFEGPEKVKILLTEGVLDLRKHTAIIFKDNQHLNFKKFAGKRNAVVLGVNNPGNKDRKNGGKFITGQKSEKSSNALKGHGSRFKSSGSRLKGCWKDPWIPNIRPLIKFILANINFDADCFFSDMVTEKGI